MTDPASTLEPSGLISGVRVVRERWWVVLIAVVASVAAIVGLSASATKQYTATSSLLLGQDKLAGIVDQTAVKNDDPVRDASTNLLLVQSSKVAERVRKALRTTESADSLRGHVVVNAEPDADIITIEATDSSARRAAALANAFAGEFVGYRQDADRQRIDRGEQLLRRQLAALPVTAVAQRAELQQTLQTLTALKTLTSGDAEVVDIATVPTAASWPRVKRDALLAVIVGLILGIATAFLVDLFDRRIKLVEDFEDAYGLRALASLPDRPRDGSSQRDRQAALEPFRILRNSLGFLAAGREVRIVLVTSAVPGEGKSTVAAGLARATALNGQRVVLVETDLRRPTFHEQFDLGGDGRGLTTALIGGTHVSELLRPVLPGLRSLMVLPSGPTPPNAAELLRSDEMRHVLTELAEVADVIVLDAPPLLPVADAQVLLDNDLVDACLIVARAYHTTREQVRRTRAILDRHPAARCGLIVNGLHALDSAYDYYGAAERGSRSALKL